MKKQVVLIILTLISCNGCAIFSGSGSGARERPISNPFQSYHPSERGQDTMVLRTKKGDRSVELEIPGGTHQLSDFVLPVSPHFKDSLHKGADAEEQSSYKNHAATPSDHEIRRDLAQASGESDEKRREIEQTLHLAPVEDNTPEEGSVSYLAKMDHIKQLYRSARFEAALLEIDDLLKHFQTDAKLYQMRGTLLDRLGRKEMAIKSWNQALKLDPKNENLRRFVDRKHRSPSGGQ